MTRYTEIKTFLIKRIIGIILLGISFLILVSLLGYSVEDPGFGAGNSNNIKNWLGPYGSHTASFLIIFIDISAYLLVVFFFISGLKLILGINLQYIWLRFILLSFGIVGFNFSLSLFNLGGGLVGGFLKDITNNIFENYFQSFYIFWFVCFGLFIASIFLIYFALGIGFYRIFSSIIRFFNITFFFVKYLKILKYLIPKFSRSSDDKSYLLKRNFRTEPTIHKSSYSKQKKSLLSALGEKKIISNKYSLPSINLLKTSNEKLSLIKDFENKNIEYGKKLEMILKEYGVEGKITNFKSGPVVTLFEFVPAAGVKTSKIIGLSNDIARAMSSLSTRISAQPGKTSIGIEIPNQKREDVYLGDLIKDEKFTQKKDSLTLALGKNISGEKRFTDLEKMPHLLIAGTTGSGKSVGINSMIISLLFRFKPSECKLILIDPKMLELSVYEDIPHLLTPVVTNPNKAVHALKWVVREMENRYKLMSSLSVKNIDSFNTKIFKALSGGRKLYREVQTGIDKDTRNPIIEKKEISLEKMPLIVVVIDEMADLMMVAGKDVENLVQRLAQMARASGIHLIAATQRPSVDVITGIIKANFPSRISFRVASRFDSRTILNEMGAEQLLGSGDMLYLENGARLTRLHGGFVSENEIEAVVNHIKSQTNEEIQKDITTELDSQISQGLDLDLDNKNIDELYEKALSIVIDQQKVSTSFIQRYLQIGYNRAARMVEKMEEEGIISEPSHAGKRSVLKKNI